MKINVNQHFFLLKKMYKILEYSEEKLRNLITFLLKWIIFIKLDTRFDNFFKLNVVFNDVFVKYHPSFRLES